MEVVDSGGFGKWSLWGRVEEMEEKSASVGILGGMVGVFVFAKKCSE